MGEKMHENIPKIQQIIIYIEGYNNFFEELHIKNELKKIFSTQVLEICESAEDYDVIIAKRIVSYSNPRNIFYMEDVFNEEKWKELLSYLISQIMCKKVQL